ncbi:MAG: SDR family oxidoreductase [Candidatus Hermodarchaeota archaeon]
MYSGGKAKAMLADASDPAAAEKVIKSTVDEFGSIDILANNAGIYPISSTLEMTEKMWDKVINLNLRGVFFFSQAVAKVVLFLASELSGYMTGSTVLVDGGYLLS